MSKKYAPVSPASGRTAFYFNVPKTYRDLGCTVPNTPLGNDYAIACGEDGNGGRAAVLNAAFDEWNLIRRGLLVTGEHAPMQHPVAVSGISA